TCHEAARVVDALLVRVARGRGALDVALGEGLATLGAGSPVLDLGYSGVGDYAREVLGIAASTAQKMIRFAKALRERPLLRSEVWRGEVTLRAAEAVLPRARGDDEAAWVERARTQTVRALKAAVKAAGLAPGRNAPEECSQNDDEKWTRMRVRLTPEQRATLDEALELARKVDGATVPKWRLVASLCEEYLGAHELPDGVTPDVLAPGAHEDLAGPLQEWLERENAQWAFLDRPDPVEAPELSTDTRHDPQRFDAELRRLAILRDRWDEVFGHLAMVFRAMHGWRRLDFASFEHYTAERLGLGVRCVEQRAALERRLYELPQLRRALQERRISYEKARLIARYSGEEGIEPWIERAERTTCISLRRELQHAEETHSCARGEFDIWAPRSAAGLVALAFYAARKAAGRWISSGECLAAIASHFIETWNPEALKHRATLQRKILERDGGVCQVPGCSRAADHVHHIRFRSAGGSDDPRNLTSVCSVHHLQGIHRGRIRVSGTAPNQLRWELGIRSRERTSDVATEAA
ncbi:MAG: HNH endonuclease, partial [Myxococcales bacterium]